jgi:hypothetical protein
MDDFETSPSPTSMSFPGRTSGLRLDVMMMIVLLAMDGCTLSLKYYRAIDSSPRREDTIASSRLNITLLQIVKHSFSEIQTQSGQI